MKENHHRLFYRVEGKYEGNRIKDILREEYKLSTRLFKSIKDNGCILLNGEITPWYNTAWEGDNLLVEMGEEKIDAAPHPIPLDIIYEDFDILLINKQPGIVVHPTKGHIYDTLANGIAYHWKEKGISCKIRFINRLDMDTSGLVLIAKNKFAHQNIQRQMEENKVNKIYLTIVQGILEKKTGTIHAPIGFASEGDIKRSVIKEGRPSVTHYKVIEEYKNASLVEIKLETGRTHQIRVHMNHIGHPLIGDRLYNEIQSDLISRQALHAEKLSFVLPRSKVYREFKAPLPEDLISLKNNLKGNHSKN